jgi:hypothetical protein
LDRIWDFVWTFFLVPLSCALYWQQFGTGLEPVILHGICHILACAPQMTADHNLHWHSLLQGPWLPRT